MCRLKLDVKQGPQGKSSFAILPLVATIIVAASTATTGFAAPSKTTTKRAMAPKTTQVAPRLYDFKGVTLEISLEEFRRLPHPDGKAARVACTGDNVLKYGKPTIFSDLTMSAHLKKLLALRNAYGWGILLLKSMNFLPLWEPSPQFGPKKACTSNCQPLTI